VAFDDVKGGGHAREGERSEKEGNRQASRVDGESKGPAAGRVGERGGGLRQFLSILDDGRIAIAALAVE